jgi:hypothetical protein
MWEGGDSHGAIGGGRFEDAAALHTVAGIQPGVQGKELQILGIAILGSAVNEKGIDSWSKVRVQQLRRWIVPILDQGGAAMGTPSIAVLPQ